MGASGSCATRFGLDRGAAAVPLSKCPQKPSMRYDIDVAKKAVQSKHRASVLARECLPPKFRRPKTPIQCGFRHRRGVCGVRRPESMRRWSPAGRSRRAG